MGPSHTTERRGNHEMDDRVRSARVGLLLQEAMVEAFEREGADRLLMLGDLLYHGPRNDLPRDYAPKEVIPMLNGLENKLCCVRGNCEAEVDQMVLDFPVMADYCHPPGGRKAHLLPPTGMSIMERTRRRWPKGTSCSTATPTCPAWTEFGQRNVCLNPGSLSHPEGKQSPQLHDHPGQPDPVEDPGRGHLPRPGPVTPNPPLARNHLRARGGFLEGGVEKARWQDVPPPAGSRGFWVIGRSAPAGGPGG